MTAALLLGSVALLLAGHLFRLLRWEQFIRIYERPMRGIMLRGMAVGYGVNFLLPFHIGDVFRAWFTGRRMKNGVGFALATVIMDRFLDVWVVALLFAAFRLAGVPGVASCVVDLDAKKATVELTADVADSVLMDAVKDAGYDPVDCAVL